MQEQKTNSKKKIFQPQSRLSTAQISAIENAIAGVGEFGEVHLVIQKGQLRFLVTQNSVDLLKLSNNGAHQD